MGKGRVTGSISRVHVFGDNYRPSPAGDPGREAVSLRLHFKDFNLQSRRDSIQGEEEEQKKERKESQIQNHTNNLSIQNCNR